MAQLPLQTLRSELDPAGLIVESTSAREGGGRFRLIPVRPDKAATPELLPPGTVRLYGVAAGGCELIYHGPHITDADWQVWNPGLPGGANGVVNALVYDAVNSRRLPCTT